MTTTQQRRSQLRELVHCLGCGTDVPRYEFSFNEGNRTGLDDLCRVCTGRGKKLKFNTNNNWKTNKSFRFDRSFAE